MFFLGKGMFTVPVYTLELGNAIRLLNWVINGRTLFFVVSSQSRLKKH